MQERYGVKSGFEPGELKNTWGRERGTGKGTFVQGVHKSETMNVKAGHYDFMRFALKPIEPMAKLTDLTTGGRILWGPSLEVIARKK